MSKKKKKFGFTLIEMIIVIAIVSILMLALKNIFQIKNKDLYYSQVCINTVYGKVSNFFHQGITSKAIMSGEVLIYPENYITTFDINQNKIFLDYTAQNGGSGNFESFGLSGDELKKYYCQSESYHILMTGLEKIIIEIDKGLQEKNANLDVFRIKDGNGNFYITGGIDFLLCDKQNILCKNLGTFIIDKRNHNIINQLCLTRSDIGNCEERN